MTDDSEIDDIGTFEPRIGQVVRWYLADAKRSERQRSDQVRRQADVWETYTSHAFRSVRFNQIDAIDMQKVVDRTAAEGSEKAAVWLRRLFMDADKFAVSRGIVPSVRAKRLLCPNIDLAPRILDEGSFAKVWETYSLCGTGGAVADRAACLAILISAATLQPLGNVVSMRRDEIDLEGRVWRSGDPCRFVHLSGLAIDRIKAAIDLGDFVHRETPTPYVLASTGPARDPYRFIGYSSIYDVTTRTVGKNATPHDLRATGVELLREHGEDLWAHARQIVKNGSDEKPDALHIAILEGWAGRVRALTKPAWR